MYDLLKIIEMVRVYKKKEKHYRELRILKAIQEIESEQSINKTAQKYGISRTPIKSRMKENAGLRTRMKQGRKTVFPVETEKNCNSNKKNGKIRFRANFARATFYIPGFCEC